MRYDARKEHWMPMEIRGVHGYFSDVRIDRKTVPEPFHIWELADADCDGMPCRYRPAVLVNFFGTFITTEELPIDDKEDHTGYIDSADEWGFTGERYQPFPYLMASEKKKQETG